MISSKLLAALVTVLVASGVGVGAYVATQPATESATVADEPEPVTAPSSSPNPQNISGSTIYAENSTIYAGENTTIINPNTTPTIAPTVTPTPQPTVTVTYSESKPDPEDQTGQTIKHTFIVTTQHLTYIPSEINTAIAPLAEKYPPLKTTQYDIRTLTWTASNFVNGQSNFNLFSTTELNESQLTAIAVDLQTAFLPLLK
jgi:hypothetical protein